MTTDSLLLFSISTAVSTGVAIFDHWLAHNPKLSANCTWQFVSRLLHGLGQAASAAPSGIEQHIIAGVAKVGVEAAESAMEPKAPVKKRDDTPNFGAGGV